MVIPPDLGRNVPIHGPRHQFPLGSSAFALFLFYKTTDDCVFLFIFLFACVQCGISCHKKCLSTLQLKCGNPRNFLHKVAPCDAELPKSLLCTVVQCIGEINERGLDVKVCCHSEACSGARNLRKAGGGSPSRSLPFPSPLPPRGDRKCGSGKCDMVKSARVENAGV